MLLQESSYDASSTNFNECTSDALLDAVLGLPVLREREVHFVDLDGTVLDDTRRFDVLPILKDHRGDAAYPVIIREFSETGDELEAFKAFIKQIDPKKHLLIGYDRFFNIKNPDHVILTAGNRLFQSMKVQAMDLGIPMERVILVDEAGQKVQAMFEYFLRQGFVPGKIRFFDDRIAHFAGKDIWMSENLGVDVSFYEATSQQGSVHVRKFFGEMVERIFTNRELRTMAPLGDSELSGIASQEVLEMIQGIRNNMQSDIKKVEVVSSYGGNDD